MKKNQSSPSPSHVDELRKRFEQTPEENPTPEPLYATVNKQNRTSPKPQPEEVLYADLNIERGRGQRPHSPGDPDYENVNPRSRGQQGPDTVYAELNIGGGGRGQHQRNLSDSDYENVTIGGGKGQHQHAPDTVYAELNIGRGGRGQHQRNLSDSDYENVTIGGGGKGQHQHAPDTVYATVKQGGPTSPTHMTPKDRITSGLLKDPAFQGRVEKLQGLCTMVYGNQYALNEQLATILDNPKKGEEILRNLMEDPQSPGKLAGQKILGMKSPDRRMAEEGFSVLCAALEEHVGATQKLHKDLTRDLTKQHSHERGAQQRHHEREAHHRERDAHHHHHERDQHSPKQDVQKYRHREEKGMAFAM